MSKDLIDPLNEDTYDDRVIVHGPIKSYLSGPAFEKFAAKLKTWKDYRKKIWHEIYVLQFQIRKVLYQ